MYGCTGPAPARLCRCLDIWAIRERSRKYVRWYHNKPTATSCRRECNETTLCEYRYSGELEKVGCRWWIAVADGDVGLGNRHRRCGGECHSREEEIQDRGHNEEAWGEHVLGLNLWVYRG